MQPTAHLSKDFDADLLAVRARVLEAGGIVEYQIRYAIEALRTGDRALVTRVIADEQQVKRDPDYLLSKSGHAPAAGRLVGRHHPAPLERERDGDDHRCEPRQRALHARRPGRAAPAPARAAAAALDPRRRHAAGARCLLKRQKYLSSGQQNVSIMLCPIKAYT